jgi:hypothetical protein
MSDINLHSFNGPEDNDRMVVILEPIVPGPEIADTIKCSTGLTGFIGRFARVQAGREDALDVNNRCQDLSLVAHAWALAGAKYGITVKGGSKNVTVEGAIEGRGDECDVDLGNYSEQSAAKTTGVSLNLWREDGQPVRVRVLHADRPTLFNGPYKWMFPSPNIWFHSFFVKAFLLFRRLFS